MNKNPCKKICDTHLHPAATIVNNNNNDNEINK